MRENSVPRTSKFNLRHSIIHGLLFGFLILLALIFLGDFKNVGGEFTNFPWRLFPIVLLLTLFNYALRFVKWHYYLHLMNITGLSWKTSLRLFVAGFPLAVSPGKAGEALKAYWLKQKTGLPFAKGVSVVVAERFSDGLAVLGLSLFGLFLYPRYWLAFGIIFCGLLVLLLFLQNRRLAEIFFSLLARIPKTEKILKILQDFYEGSYVLFRPIPALTGIGLGMVSWMGEGIGFFVILHGLGYPLDTRVLITAVFILSFSTIIGAISSLPGGLGAAEASIAGILIFTLDAPTALASAATLLIRLATLWFGVGLGLVIWLFSADLFKRGIDD